MEGICSFISLYDTLGNLAAGGEIVDKETEIMHAAASPREGAEDEAPETELGDFTTTSRVLPISAIAIGIGLLSAYVSLGLLKLINLFTNLFFFQKWATTPSSPADHTLGAYVILVPVVGAMLIGLLARFGSDRIRGHGIPEAIEAILLRGGRVEAKVAMLKPLSAAISIGSGGPFGAEGPIIMTGGAFGSLVAQCFHLTNAERRTLLVAGAAAGMSATFASPIAAVLLAVELLLFELKPRSFIPVALASATAAAARRYLLGMGPLFPTPPHPLFIGPDGLFGCVMVGLLAGAFSVLLTKAVYAAEDMFAKLPIHWMWWPPIGGLVIGVGGLIFPQALGVGYETIGRLLQGDVPRQVLLGVLLVKSVIWAVSLGSGTSGGVLAPLLMMGGALGGLEAMVLPDKGLGFWPLVSMGAILGGTMRVPLTAVAFALELTHDMNVLLPLLVAGTIAHAVTVLALRRSILTEKVSRRGFHLSREYAVDPLEILFVREVMRTSVVALPGSLALGPLARSLHGERPERRQRLYPVLDEGERMMGVVTRREIVQHADAEDLPDRRLSGIARTDVVVAHPDDSLRVVAYRMAETGRTLLPVIERNGARRLVGLVSLTDLLKARALNLEAEQRRERVQSLHVLFPFGQRARTAAEGGLSQP
jgi:CIC family chloride channel protein